MRYNVYVFDFRGKTAIAYDVDKRTAMRLLRKELKEYASGIGTIETEYDGRMNAIASYGVLATAYVLFH